MTLHLRSYETPDLDFYIKFVQRAARNLLIPTSGTASLPTTKELITVPRSHFVHKKTQENFARLTHRRAIKVFDTSPEVLDLWLRYIKQHAMAGIGMKAYVHEMVEYGFASGEIEKVEEALGGNRVQQLAAQYIVALKGKDFDPVVPKIQSGEEASKKEGSKDKEGLKAKEALKETVAEFNGAEAVVEGEAAKPKAEKAEKAEKSEKSEKSEKATPTKEEKEEVKEAEAQIEGADAVVNAPESASKPAPKAPSKAEKKEAKEEVKEAEAQFDGADAVVNAPEAPSKATPSKATPSKATPSKTAKKEVKEELKEAEAQFDGADAVVNAPSKDKATKPSKKAPTKAQKTEAKEELKEAEAQFDGADAVVNAPKPPKA